MTNCKKYQGLIERHLDGDANDTESADLKAHTEECTACHEEFQRIGLADGIIKDAFTPATSAGQAADLTVAKLTALPAGTRRETFSVWRTAAKSRITKLAAAAVIIVAVIIGIKSFNGNTAWADVVEAFSKATDIHAVMKSTALNGDVRKTRELWLKNRIMIRQEHPAHTSFDDSIDDGVNYLTLNKEKKTAQLSDSYSPFEDYLREHTVLAVVGAVAFPDKNHRLKTKFARKEGSWIIYKMEYRNRWKGEVWIDAASNLPMRVVGDYAERSGARRRGEQGFEMTFDYQPIPEEVFSTAIPAGYVELPRVKSRVLSGRVIDEGGRGVAGAEVYAPGSDFVPSITNEKGEFAIKMHPTVGIPTMVLRALKKDEPHHSAWTLLRGHEHENHVRLTIADEKQLSGLMPGHPGEVILHKDKYGTQRSSIKGVVLKMAPSRVISGRVTSEAGKPIANTVVWLDAMGIRLGSNDIHISNLGCASEGSDIMSWLPKGKPFTLTDDNGHYELAGLPEPWREVGLVARADGYATEEKAFSQENNCDFRLTAAGVIVRGTVIDNHGRPLAGREVEVAVGRDLEIEPAIIDAQGRFELTGCPEVPSLRLSVNSDGGAAYGEWHRDKETGALKLEWTNYTEDSEFTYYLDSEVVINVEPGKREYQVEIVPERPDITIEVEIKDSAGRPLEGIPLGLSAGDITGQWSVRKLIGKTDEKGICTITEVPRVQELYLWVCQPELARGQGSWRKEVSDEYTKAITESQDRYAPMKVPIELQPARKHYKISVTLQTN
jgi:protocatechuate 3,4-dioxygenase beta subunit